MTLGSGALKNLLNKSINQKIKLIKEYKTYSKELVIMNPLNFEL